MTTEHERFIRQAFALAAEAVRRGDDPFGALLVLDGQVLLTAANTIHTENDLTRHAELNLVSQASRGLPAEVLRRGTLYTSTEPCVMCSGAIFWAGIPQVVFGCSAEAVARHYGANWAVACRETFARLHSDIEVIGPLLEAEGLLVHGAASG
jgi:tRNA(Arg) A34 adenosine deaminase TadA